jgi:hypothetical protein
MNGKLEEITARIIFASAAFRISHVPNNNIKNIS